MNTAPKIRLETQFGELRSDLAQLDTVLDDAIAMLFAAFTNISGLVKLEQKLASQLALAHEAKRALAASPDADAPTLLPYCDTPVSLLLAQHAVLADQVETQISAVVRSLQFQDMCSQILAHAGNRLDTLETALAGGAGGATAAGGETDAAARTTAEVIEFPRTRPVAQHGMQTGEVEIF